jgi:prepilin-type N-terminal cleavage/methylation domain-containing protein
MRTPITATSRKRGFQSGISLVELMVAIAIASIMLVGLYAGFSSSFAVLQLARENLRATQILQERMETIRLYNWEQVNTPGFIGTNFLEAFYPGTNSGSGLVYKGRIFVGSAPIAESYSNELRLVVVDVNWVSAKVKRTRQMSTFVSKYGLQHYIY